MKGRWPARRKEKPVWRDLLVQFAVFSSIFILCFFYPSAFPCLWCIPTKIDSTGQFLSRSNDPCDFCRRNCFFKGSSACLPRPSSPPLPPGNRGLRPLIPLTGCWGRDWVWPLMCQNPPPNLPLALLCHLGSRWRGGAGRVGPTVMRKINYVQAVPKDKGYWLTVSLILHII